MDFSFKALGNINVFEKTEKYFYVKVTLYYNNGGISVLFSAKMVYEEEFRGFYKMYHPKQYCLLKDLVKELLTEPHKHGK